MKLLSTLALFLSINLLNAQINVGFESTPAGAYASSNAVSSWTISSQIVTGPPACNTLTWAAGSPEFSVISTPFLTSGALANVLNVISHSPLGGNKIARLNGSTPNSTATKIAQTYTLNSSNAVFKCAVAGAWEACGPGCCQIPGYKIIVKDQSETVLTCWTESLVANALCNPSSAVYSISPSGMYWTDWQIKTLDLSPFIGTSVTIEIITNDCPTNSHFGTLFFDGAVEPATHNISFCAGSGQANLCGPSGYLSYSWTAPPNAMPIPSFQSSLTCISVGNPLAGSVYSLNLTSANACLFIATYTVAFSQVQLGNISVKPSCSLVSSGSATVTANGSASGYLYNWINSANTVVGTNSVASNLAPGIYTVNISSAGSASSTCGNVSYTLSIGTTSQIFNSVVKPFCGNEAYLQASSGSNFQWYNGTNSISVANGGTASSYTATSAAHGAIYYVAYQTSTGCRDSSQITLAALAQGSIGISNNPLICSGTTNGLATVSMSPVAFTAPGLNWFTVISTGTTPAYSSSVNPTASNTFSVSNLSEGTYSVNAFDGSCKYSSTFSVTALAFNYTLIGSPGTLCPGQSATTSVSFASPPALGQYTYSWTPNLNISATTFSSAVITPTAAPGNSVTTVYSVVVTPTLLNCPLTKTISVTAFSPVIPTISTIPSFCSGDPTYTISVNPSGGQFTPIVGLNSNGSLFPQLANLGSNTFTFIPDPQGSCTLSPLTGNFMVNSIPGVVPMVPLSICLGQSNTLTSTQANISYSWSTGSTNSFVVISPSVTTSYTLFQLNTVTSCSSNIVLTQTVVPVPTLNITAPNSICSGKSATLTASGANTYSWNNNAAGSSLIVSPSATTSYTLTGANSPSCQSTSMVHTLTVMNSPLLNFSGNTAICNGESIAIIASGADEYVWSNGSTSSILITTPLSTSVYTTVGTNTLNMCTGSKTVAITVSECSGIDKLALSQIVSIYPNPTNEKLFVETSEKINLSITDALGRIILEEEFEIGEHVLDLSTYNKGIYFVKTFCNGKTQTTKVIKSY